MSMENITVFAKTSPEQATAKLVIKDFVEVMTTSKPGKGYTSDTFTVGDTPMAIRVYPNGHNDKNTGNVAVYLLNQSDAALTVKCQFITEAKTWDFDHEVLANMGCGNYNFLSHAQCTEAFKEKDFVVTAKVEIPDGEGLLKIMGNQDAVVPKKICVCKNLYDQMMTQTFLWSSRVWRFLATSMSLLLPLPSLKQW